MPEMDELRKLAEEAIAEQREIDEHVHMPTLVSTLRLVNEKLAMIEARFADLEKRIERLEKQG